MPWDSKLYDGITIRNYSPVNKRYIIFYNVGKFIQCSLLTSE